MTIWPIILGRHLGRKQGGKYLNHNQFQVGRSFVVFGLWLVKPSLKQVAAWNCNMQRLQGLGCEL